MTDWPPRSAYDPPSAPRDTSEPRRSFMRATRVVPDRAAAPVPLDLRDFPSAFGELKTLLLEVETQFRWDSQQTTWEACAEHWRRRVREFDPGDADLAWRLSRALLDFEASLKIDAQRATWIDVSRNDWTAGVRSLRDQWPIPDPATALRHSARYLDELIGSVVPEAMKPLSEGGWSGSEFELWHARLRRVRVCVPEEPLVFRSESQSQLQPQQVRNVTRREWNASETRSSLLNSELNLRRLRQDENYQNLVEHYRRGIRSGVVADVDWEAERQRPDATRDALIQAAVSTMVTQDANERRTEAPLPPAPRTRVPTHIEEAANVRLVGSDPVPVAFDFGNSRPVVPGAPLPSRLLFSVPPAVPVDADDWENDLERETAISPGAFAREEVPDSDSDTSSHPDESPEAVEAAHAWQRSLRRHSVERDRPAPGGGHAARQVLVSQLPGITGLTREFSRTCMVPPADARLPSTTTSEMTHLPSSDAYVLPGSPNTAYATPDTSPPGDSGDGQGDSQHAHALTAVTQRAERLHDLLELREHQITEFDQRLDQATQATEEATDAVTCQICFGAKRDALVMPCCHLLYCHRCVTRATAVAENRGQPVRCPCCRGPISGVLRCRLNA